MIVLLTIDAVVAAILVPLALHERQVVHDATSFGAFFVGDDVRDAVAATNGLAGLHFVLFLAIAVLWMIWMWRAATNTSLLRRYKPRFANGFAIGGWFIPFAFWVIPGMHMYDIDKGSGPVPRPGERPRGSGLLVVWWITFVLGWIGSGTGQVTVKYGRRYDASSFDSRNAIFLAAMVLMVVAAVLAILVVRRITRAAARGVGRDGLRWWPTGRVRHGAPAGRAAAAAGTRASRAGTSRHAGASRAGARAACFLAGAAALRPVAAARRRASPRRASRRRHPDRPPP